MAKKNCVVTAPLVVVYDEQKVQHYVYQNAPVPDFVSDEDVKALLDQGLVSEVKASRAPVKKNTPPKDPAGKNETPKEPVGPDPEGETLPPAPEDTGADAGLDNK